jgi:trimethylamine---corrinoid protein Co-methyltransferase
MLNLSTPLRVASADTLARIHEATLQVLERAGIAFKAEAALAVFKQHGAPIDGEVVRIPRKMTENAIASAPRQFGYFARRQERSVVVGAKQAVTYISPNNGPIYIQDIENGRRPGSMEDLINLYKLCQASEVCDLVGAIPVAPGDLDERGKHLAIFHQLLRHTDKPLIGFVAPSPFILEMFEMLEIAFGMHGRLSERPVIGVSVNPLSPLRFDRDACETLMTYARFRQPVFVLSCAQAGVSSPSSLLGTAVLQNAEILAGLVLTQLISPGTPFMYSPASAVPNMATAAYVTGSPESNLINIVGIQLANELYRIPSRSMAGLTDAKQVDCQSGYETMQNLFMLMMAGVHVVNECLGVLDSIMTTSYEKFVLDEEMIDRVRRVQKGIDASEDALSVGIIQEIAQTGSYLMHPSTLKACRSNWKPTLAFWGSYRDWEKRGYEDLLTRAHRRYRAVLAASPASVLDPSLDRELQAYVAAKTA